MKNVKSVTNLVSDQSGKLNELLNHLDSKLKDAISKLPLEKQLELYGKLNQQYQNKLNSISKK